MKSLHTRLDNEKEEVLKVTETLGRLAAMNAYAVKDYPAFCRWLKDVTGDINFGLRPKLNHSYRQTLGDQLVDAFLRKVEDLEAQNESLSRRIEFLDWTLSHTKGKDEMQALAIYDVCR